ncbi:MAG: ATP-binding cassette domain-containing protein [Alphaproteobacteria bacterium GM7ARS4]|nr:ATP-binding cassette domain-containing protein [Alphaproteobacteria bacterium GM7ARS4]
MPVPERVVELKKVSLRLNEQDILRNITSAIARRQRVMLLGANGAGKTMLMRIVYGLLTPSAGVVWRQRTIHPFMVFSKPAFLYNCHCLRNILFALSLCRYPKAQRIERAHEALTMAGLHTLRHTPVRRLSSGQMQLLALARAWCVKPDFLLMDEPTTHLDAHNSKRFDQMMDDFCRKHCTILMSTHDLNQARALGTDIWLMRKGELVQHDSTETFFARHTALSLL